MAHLVDTDILIDVAKKNEAAIDYLDSLEDWSISVIAAMELMVGARNQREGNKINQFISGISVAPLEPQIGEFAYELVRRLARSHGLRVFDCRDGGEGRADSVNQK